jgi:hypothetical protein
MKKLKKRGSVTLYLVFLIIAIIIVMISAVAAPMGVLFNTRMYQAGEDIMLQANESINDIDNATVRARLHGVVGNGLSNVENNIEVNNALFQYGWVLLIGLSALVVFLFTRRIVEYGGGGLI